MSYIPEPITRIDKYLAYIAGNMDVALPDYPITRKEHYLAAWAEKSGFEDVDVTGEPPLTLENAIGKPLKGLKIYGRSKQVTTTGAQLFPPPSLGSQEKNGITIDCMEDEKIRISGTAEITTDFYVSRIQLSAGTYTFSAGVNIDASVLRYALVDDIGAPYFDVDGDFTTDTIAETIDTSLMLRVYAGKTIDLTVQPMLNAGSALLPWEPYTGGLPSPSPDYPQEIESVGTKWSTGANLVDVHNAIKINAYGLAVAVKDDGTIIISGTSSNNSKNLSFSFLNNKFPFPLTSIFKCFDVEEKNCKLSSVRRTNMSDATNNGIAIDINQINSGNPIYCSFKLVVSERAVEEYEPYTGGIPKPYGDKIGVNVHGKNLLRIDNSLEKYESEEYAGTANRIISSGMVAIGLDNANLFAPQYISNCVMDNGSISYHTKSPGFAVGIGAQLTPGQTYTCSFDSTNNGRLCLLYYDANGTCLKKQDFVKSTFTVPENVVYTVLLFRDADKAGDYKFWNIKLESGDTATTYEPYHAPQSMDIATPNGLPGIPVSSGGNYIDADGRQWICDEVDFARGVYVQRVAYTTVDGSVIKFIPDSLNMFWNLPSHTSPGVLGGCYVYSSFFPTSIFGVNANYDFLYTQPANMKEYFETVDKLNEFCKSKYDARTPLTLYYALATPIETPLTSDQLAAYKQLHTYKGTTIIDNDAGAYMSVKYEKMK